MPFGPFEIVLLALLAVMVFFMFRNSKKRRTDAEALREKMVPGVEVMTNFGLFGTLLSVDEDSNVASIETSPGTVLRVHRQTLSRVVEDDTTTATEDEVEASGPAETPAAIAEPGVAEKPARRTGNPTAGE